MSKIGGSYQQSDSSSGASGNNYGIDINTMLESGVDFGYGLTQGGSYGEQSSSGSSSSQSSSTTNQDIWGTQSPFLEAVYNAAQGGYNGAQAGIQAMQPTVQNQINAQASLGNLGYANQMMGGAAANLGPSAVGQMGASQVAQMAPTQASQLGPSTQAQMQGNSLQQGMLQGYNGNNPYMAGMKDMIAEDAQRLKQQNLGSLDARAAAAGMSGSSGYRNQVTDMMENVDENAMNQMTNLGYQANTQAIQDRMRLAGAADQLNMQAAGAGDQYGMNLAGMNDQMAFNRANNIDQYNMNQAGAMDQYGMQQAGMIDANVNNAFGQTQAMQQAAMNQFNPSMMGLQTAGQFGQIIGGPTSLTQGSSQSSSQSSQGSTGFNSSFNNGMNLGLGMNASMGWGTGSNSGAQTSASDSDSMGASITNG